MLVEPTAHVASVMKVLAAPTFEITDSQESIRGMRAPYRIPGFWKFVTGSKMEPVLDTQP